MENITLDNIKKNLGISEFNKIQVESMEKAKSHNELILLAPTGTGKTLGYLLPILNKINPNVEGVQALILVPSRELALQIEKVFKSIGSKFKINCCYGGHAFQIEQKNLSQPPQVLVGTPGRIASHIEEETFDYSTVESIVFDEFDKALEFGFLKDMEYIYSSLRSIEYKMLTSATDLSEYPEFLRLNQPQKLNHLTAQIPKPLTVLQTEVKSKEKLTQLLKLIYHLKAERMIIFCNHRAAVERISAFFKEEELEHQMFHGGMEQIDRERALVKFRNDTSLILITTDLAARGLDIPMIQHVIHYQLPPKEDAFIHRNGRTARMNETGNAYMLLADDDEIPEYVNTYPRHFDIPQDAPKPAPTQWETIYVSAGKKNKINKIDLVGLFIKKGNLDKNDIGLIEVKDFISFIAVKKSKAALVAKRLNKERVKKIKVKVDIAQ
ncbi:DEAD/DEAH box helicase [Flammeovirga sp. MY04]|uniref:DEAD/DEAH box helicase n=1 Tax=Flammeovirga sp. MY04 TaxID=1191459 RepID=UPI0008063B01|nr:DEAD/DEAH box helicase [Flammeovirga sp. MY04]ANQ52660.1 DEAD/DEAH box helicase [Flammeovirga sp. MY04]